jgi:hypothetical protein
VSTKLDGTYICSYTVELLKPQLVNDGGVVIDIINVVMFEHQVNADSPMLVTLPGMLTDVKAEHQVNA